MNLEFNNQFFRNYLQFAPLALAIERTWECKLLEKKEFKSPVMDVGSGEGIFAHILFKDTVDLGVDPNNRELERAKIFNKYNVLLNCFGQDIPKADNSFHTIFSNSVLEHIPDIDAVLREIHRVLKKEGRLYVTLPTDKFEKFSLLYTTLNCLRLKKIAMSFAKKYNSFWRHFHCYNASQWEKKFKENGFEIIEKIEYASREQCLLNDLFCYFSILPYFTKKISNRWFVSHKIRAFTSSFLNRIFSPFSELMPQAPGNGGLIFFELKKSEK